MAASTLSTVSYYAQEKIKLFSFITPAYKSEDEISPSFVTIFWCVN